MQVPNARHDATEMFFNDSTEQDFLYSFLTPEMIVCEYGSGNSTKAIAARVKEVHSIEHHKGWAEKVKAELPENAFLYYVPCNKEEGPGEDGTYEEYRRYVNYPRKIGKKFDLVLVDGRSRVACCRAAIELLAPGGIIMLHDHHNPQPEFDRPEYHVVDEFLEEIGHVYALYAYRPK